MKVRTEAKFSAAHRLFHYVGKCNNLHGHTWRAEVVLEGEQDPTTDMLADFARIKEAITYYDHMTILNSDDPLVSLLVGAGVNVRTLASQDPTAEALAWDFFTEINESLGKNVRVELVRVWESETSYAEV